MTWPTGQSKVEGGYQVKLCVHVDGDCGFC